MKLLYHSIEFDVGTNATAGLKLKVSGRHTKFDKLYNRAFDG
jgi:hypothetical protein